MAHTVTRTRSAGIAPPPGVFSPSVTRTSSDAAGVAARGRGVDHAAGRRAVLPTGTDTRRRPYGAELLTFKVFRARIGRQRRPVPLSPTVKHGHHVTVIPSIL